MCILGRISFGRCRRYVGPRRNIKKFGNWFAYENNWILNIRADFGMLLNYIFTVKVQIVTFRLNNIFISQSIFKSM